MDYIRLQPNEVNSFFHSTDMLEPGGINEQWLAQVNASIAITPNQEEACCKPLKSWDIYLCEFQTVLPALLHLASIRIDSWCGVASTSISVLARLRSIPSMQDILLPRA